MTVGNSPLREYHRQLAQASARVYNRHTHEAGSSQAALEILDNGLSVLAFRGTERDFDDIKTDLRFLPWYDSTLGAWCHSGFLKSTRALYPALLPDVYSVLSRGDGLAITGHSLGAAQATIFACLLIARGAARPEKITVVGFGSPAPQYGRGLDKWLKHVPVTMFKRGSDAVPSHPAFGTHVVPLTQIRPNDTLARSMTRERWKDHRIARYIVNFS